MKIVKFGAIALALGLFAASCNEGTTTETTTTDTTVTAPAPMETTAPATTAPMTTDSAAMMAPGAGTDTAAMKMETKTTENKMK